MKHEIHYGKADVKVYRTHGAPLRGVTQIPESAFSGRDNVLMGAEIEVTVRGDAFWDAYTVGDPAGIDRFTPPAEGFLDRHHAVVSTRHERVR